MVLWTAALYAVVELVTGNAIEPMLYGHSTGLSPFSVIVAATFWTWLWGPIGLILSTPLTLCLVVLGRHVERLEFLDVLLGDRPALTPVESFYQRMLTGDTDEALEQAELLLRDRALSSYYDEVALKGLQLAANDFVRGVLTQMQLERIQSTIVSLVRDFDDHDDADPQPPGDEDAPTTPSRAEVALPKQPAPEGVGAAARAAAAGVAVRRRRSCASPAVARSTRRRRRCWRNCLPSTDSARAWWTMRRSRRTAIRHLDVSGVAMVCVSYLELTGSPSHLRYLVRRLRMRLPTQPLLIGLWPSEEAVLRDDRLRAAVGADHYTSSLREAVEACLDALHQAEIAAGSAAEPADRAPADGCGRRRAAPRSAQASPQQRRRDLRARAQAAAQGAGDLGLPGDPAPIGQRHLAHAQARARGAHLHLEVPAIGHLAQAERLEPVEADRAKRAHVGVAHAAEQPDRGTDQPSGKDLVGTHAARLARAARARREHEIGLARQHRCDQRGRALGRIGAVAVEEQHDFGAQRTGARGAGGTGAAIARTCLDQHLGAGGARLLLRPVAAAAIDDEHVIDAIARQGGDGRADRAGLVQHRDDGDDARRHATATRPLPPGRRQL